VTPDFEVGKEGREGEGETGTQDPEFSNQVDASGLVELVSVSTTELQERVKCIEMNVIFNYFFSSSVPVCG
jgi:hypothetical protein